MATGQPDNVIVIRKGSQTEVQSGVDRAVRPASSRRCPAIATGADGTPLVSKEPVVLINLPKRDTGKRFQRGDPRRDARTASRCARR